MSTTNNNRSESSSISRGLSSKDVGKRDLGIKKGTSKASKLLGTSTEELLNSSTSNLLNSSDNSNDSKLKRGGRFFRRHSSSEMIDSTSTGGRNSTNSAASSSASSNKSGIGGILKGLGLKGKPSSKFNDSDSDLQISSEHTTNREYKSRNTFPTTAVQKNNKKPHNRAVSWGADSIDESNTDKPTPLYSPTNDMNKGRYLMERNMSRRNRQSFRLGRGGGTSFNVNPSDPRATQGDPFNNIGGIGKCNNMVKHIRVNAILSSTNASTKSLDFEKEDSLETVILDSLSKKGLCDVQLVGGLDNVVVDAPSYLLGVHSEVFESMFYPSSSSSERRAAAQDEKRRPSRRISDDEFRDSCTSVEEILEMDLQEEEEDDDDNLDTSLRLGDDGVLSPSKRMNNKKKQSRVELPFATSPAIQATLHFLATRSLPPTLEKEESETNIRTLVQVHLLGRIYKINSLEDHSNRTARLLMNKMPRLVCAAFDECIASKERLPIITERMSFVSSSHDELMEYCLDYLRDSPLTTLLEGGTIFLNNESIRAIICDQDMDVDEHTMFHILNTWVNQDVDNNIETGKELVSNINLAYIKSDYLNNIVRKCGFVETSIIEKALRDIEEMMENQSPDEKEHVLVEGAGNKDINGIYVRMDEDIGLGEEEVMYVKEAQDDDDGYGADYGLYLLRSTWAITSCVDYSNVLYSCKVGEKSSTNPSRAPKDGWKAVNGNNPPPFCTWSPGKDLRVAPSGKGYVAPNLADAGKNKKRLTDISNGDHCEGSLVRRLTLRTLCNLPTDEDFEEDDYHGDE